MSIPPSEVFQQVAKADCHMHLTGALGPEDLIQLAAQVGVDIGGVALARHYTFGDPVIWPIAKRITSRPEGLFGALKLVVDRAREDNVMHIEPTINTWGMMRDHGLTTPDLVAVVRDAGQYAEEVGVRLQMKCGVNRRDGAGSVGVVARTFENLPEAYRSMIDLNGDEHTLATWGFARAFKALAASGIPFSVHAGELGTSHYSLVGSLLYALDMGPTRIAHATVAMHHDRALQRLVDQGVVVEVAPTSNVMTGAVGSMQEHPVTRFARAGVRMVFGTDDPAFFHNTMTTELAALQAAGLTTDEVLALNEQSLEIAGAGTSR